MKAFYLYRRAESDTLTAKDEEPIFVASGFSWEAFFFSHLWLVYHRLWYFLFLSVAIQLLFYHCSTMLSYPASFLLQGLPSLLLGSLAHSLREIYLKKNGYTPFAIVMANNIVAAQLKFFRKGSSPETS